MAARPIPLTICIIFLCVLPLSVSAAILITRVQIAGDAINDEYVEITNAGTASVNLAGYQLAKETSSCKEQSIILNTSKFVGILAPGKTLRIAHPDARVDHADLLYSNKSTTLAADNTILLSDKSKTVIDTLGYGKACDFEGSPAPNPAKNEQLARRKSGTVYQDTGDNSADFVIEGRVLPPSPSASSATTVRLNEFLPNPSGGENLSEYIELYNYGSAMVDLRGWMLHDASQTGKYTFATSTPVKPHEFLVLYRTTFVFALNNDRETISLFDPSGTIIDTATSGTAAEDVSYDFDGTDWHWSRILTPGSANHLNSLPVSETSVPDEAYAGIAEDFSAESRDPDGDSVKYVWDFGDDHKSSLQNTTHTYDDTGKYTVTLTINDGSETDTKTFTVSVDTYPRPKVRIIALMPNPPGKDTGNEYIELKNFSKKTVRLKGWKIATKTPKGKSFSNHIILSKITIKPGETKKITYNDCRFTLNNTATKIALRTPDGHTLQTLRYSREKSAGEGDLYAHLPDTTTPVQGKSSTKNKKLAKGKSKIKSSWQWIAAAPAQKPLAQIKSVQDITAETLVVETLPPPAIGSISLDTSRERPGWTSIDSRIHEGRILGVSWEQLPAPITTRSGQGVSPMTAASSTADMFSRFVGSLNTWFTVLFR